MASHLNRSHTRTGWSLPRSLWTGAMTALVSLGLAVGASAQPDAAKKDEPLKNAAGEPVNADTKTVYLVNLRGEFGRDVSSTPFRKVMDDIKKNQPDIVVFKLDFEFKKYGQTKENFETDVSAFGEIETARELITLFTENVKKDSTWTKKPNFVMWIKRALGGSAFLPFAAADVFYTSDGLHGGIGEIERIAAGMDQRVREKMIGITMARAEGLAQLGGHDSRILKAMSEMHYKLSVSYKGGKPEFHEDYTGDEIIKEDALEDESKKDTEAQIARFEGNDILTLNAEKAKKLGLSRGTVDSLDELMFEYGSERNYRVTEGRGAKILNEWSKDVSDAEREFAKLWGDYNRLQITGTTATDRNQERGRQLGMLRKIQSLLKTYKEAINPRAIRGAPANWESQIEIIIEQIRQQQRGDR